MASLVDGFAVLPGGMGTLDETFEALTWFQLGIYGKPVGVLNVEGYWAISVASSTTPCESASSAPSELALDRDRSSWNLGGRSVLARAKASASFTAHHPP